MSEIRPKLVAYTIHPKDEFNQFRTTLENPTFFQRPASKYDYFYTTDENIRIQYAKYCPDVKEFKLGAKAGSKVGKAVESFVEDAKKTAKEESPEEPEEIVEAVAEEAASESEEVTLPEIPDDLESLSWSELRSLASHYTDKKQFKKPEAIDILTKAKG